MFTYVTPNLGIMNNISESKSEIYPLVSFDCVYISMDVKNKVWFDLFDPKRVKRNVIGQVKNMSLEKEIQIKPIRLWLPNAAVI